MSEGGAGNADCNGSATGNTPPSSPTEQSGQRRGTVDSSEPPTDQEHGKLALHEEIRVVVPARVVRRRPAIEGDNGVDEELRALGLWEAGMTEEEKVNLLKVVADSKETARREEDVRKSHFAWQTVPTDVVQHAWQQKEPAVGLVKPCFATSEPPVRTGGLERTPRMNIAIGNKDDEYPALGEVPPKRKVATPKKSKPTLSPRRVCSMEQPLNLQWEDEDSSDDLYDSRLPQKHTASSSADRRNDSREVENLPAGEGLHSHSSSRVLPQGAAGAVSKEEGLRDNIGIMNSWATVHKTLRAAQSGQGLPVRPWGHPRDPSSAGGDEDTKPQDLGNPPKQDKPEGGAGSTRAMEGAESCG